MLGRARRRIGQAGLRLRISLVQANVARLPLADSSVDAVTGHSFLYLLPDRQVALAEMLRALRPGGRVALMEPNAGPVGPRAVVSQSRDPRHIVSASLWRPFSRVHGRFTAATLCATLEGAGFTRCSVEETLGGLGLLGWADKP
jgi:ubiquinone/menaquinone biosynthesis C-methylase UbiE